MATLGHDEWPFGAFVVGHLGQDKWHKGASLRSFVPRVGIENPMVEGQTGQAKNPRKRLTSPHILVQRAKAREAKKNPKTMGKEWREKRPRKGSKKGHRQAIAKPLARTAERHRQSLKTIRVSLPTRNLTCIFCCRRRPTPYTQNVSLSCFLCTPGGGCGGA